MEIIVKHVRCVSMCLCASVISDRANSNTGIFTSYAVTCNPPCTNLEVCTGPNMCECKTTILFYFILFFSNFWFYFYKCETVLEETLTFLSTFLTTPTCVSHCKENRDLPLTLSPVKSYSSMPSSLMLHQDSKTGVLSLERLVDCVFLLAF